MTLENLHRVREGMATKVWHQAPFAPARGETVLAVDQSIASTGWVLMTSYMPWVIDTGVIITEVAPGHEGSLQRSIVIHDEVAGIISRHSIDRIAHEMPPVMGAGMARPESSLLASLAVRLAGHTAGIEVGMESAQAARVRICGSARASKGDLKVALSNLWPHLPDSGMRWNEHIRDAVAVGIMAMERA